MAYRLWRALLLGLFWVFGIRYRVEGQPHEPKPPYIIVVNHASAADIPLVGAAVRAPVSFMTKEELMRNPLVRAWILSGGSFFVKRGQPDRAAIRTAFKMLARGRAVCLFGEGTRSLDGRLQPFEQGVAYLALRTGVPVLPIAIIGSHRIIPKGARWLRPASVVIKLGEALAPPSVTGRLTHALVQDWTERFHGAVADLLPVDQQPQNPVII